MTNYHGFKTREELKSHIESVLSILKEYEGTKCIIQENKVSPDKSVFFVKNKGKQFHSWCSTLDKAVDKFLEVEGIISKDI